MKNTNTIFQVKIRRSRRYGAWKRISQHWSLTRAQAVAELIGGIVTDGRQVVFEASWDGRADEQGI